MAVQQYLQHATLLYLSASRITSLLFSRDSLIRQPPCNVVLAEQQFPCRRPPHFGNAHVLSAAEEGLDIAIAAH